MVSKDDKVNFLKYVLSNHKLKKRECVWILNYLMNNKDSLENIKFVSEGVSHYKRGVNITASGIHSPDFQFFKNGLVTTDPEKAFHDIRMNTDKITYIKINYKGFKTCTNYAAVVEDELNLPLNSEYSELADKFMNQCLLDGKRNILKKQIDMALDQGNEEEFKRLSSQLLLVK